MADAATDCARLRGRATSAALNACARQNARCLSVMELLRRARPERACKAYWHRHGCRPPPTRCSRRRQQRDRSSLDWSLPRPPDDGIVVESVSKRLRWARSQGQAARSGSAQREEVRSVLNALHGVPYVVASLLYGAGLRLQECLDLQVHLAAVQRIHERDWPRVSGASQPTGESPDGEGRPTLASGHSDGRHGWAPPRSGVCWPRACRK